MAKSWPAVVALLAAGAVLAGGCSGGPGGSDPEMVGTQPAGQIVKPAGNIVPAGGGGDVPEATLAVCRQCQSKLQNGENAALMKQMDQSLTQAATRRNVRAPSKRAVALLCAGAARTNLGLHKEALEKLRAASQVREDLPAETRPQLLELLYHAELVSSAAIGDSATAQAALEGLRELGRNTDQYIKDVCSAAPAAGTLPECGASTPSSGPAGSPSGGTGTPAPGPTPPGGTEPVPTDDTTVTQEPGTQEPGSEEPGTQEPGSEEPGTQEPGPQETDDGPAAPDET
ncbi:hypothetical protein [Nonomuraea zeae]|uniref:hypothetical protein n=1 Tax=Nonomuraea zeae TaxID=1642303 RepID=UPI0014784B7C|nr:hypothetical protein [Nonomuraea zeae]